jgi:prepilin-type N-terminal cleavage/methylation domain-containing protein
MRGFTIVELLIVLALTALLVAMVPPIYGNLEVSAQLNEQTAQIVQTIRTARSRSIARLNSAQHGVYFSTTGGTDSYTLYQGATYAGRDASYDRTTTLDQALQLTETLSGTEVVFALGSGTPSTTGTVRITHEVSGSRLIDVNAWGRVGEQ